MKFVKRYFISISLMVVLLILLPYSIFITMKDSNFLGIYPKTVDNTESEQVIGKVVGTSYSEGYERYVWDEDTQTTKSEYIEPAYMVYIKYDGITYSLDSQSIYVKLLGKENKKVNVTIQRRKYDDGKEEIDIMDVGSIVKKKKKKKK